MGNKLELTWYGKEEPVKIEPRLLIHDSSKDYGDADSENMLIHGDNLLALKALEKDFTGKIKCIYIDPPYNTGSAFEHYDDNLEKIDCVIDKESLNDSYRNNQSICSYSSQLYEEYGETGTKQFEVTGHDGVFLVRQDDVAAYLEEFKPMQLREKRTVKVNDGYAAINMGESKGLTFDRVLIYPTGTMKSWMKNHSKTLQPKTRSQFYVAVTRAKYSVGIVFDYNEKTNIEGVEKYR
jgi:DNA helicase-2/ATP-dependent DNA helicase PcrA